MESQIPENKPKKSFQKSDLIGIGFQLGFIIALPVVIFGLIGKWLDASIGTYPVLTLVGVFAAMIFTGIWIYKKFKGYF